MFDCRSVCIRRNRFSLITSLFQSLIISNSQATYNYSLHIFSIQIRSVGHLSSDSWQMTVNMWQMTCHDLIVDMWQFTCDIWRLTFECWTVFDIQGFMISLLLYFEINFKMFEQQSAEVCVFGRSNCLIFFSFMYSIKKQWRADSKSCNVPFSGIWQRHSQMMLFTDDWKLHIQVENWKSCNFLKSQVYREIYLNTLYLVIESAV